MSQKPKLLILDSQLYYGGGETYKLDMIRILHSKGVECTVFLPEQSQFNSILQDEPVNTAPFTVKTRLDFLGMFRFARKFRGRRDLIVCTSDSVTWYTGVFFKLLRSCRKLVAVVHISTLESGSDFSWWKRKIIKLIDRSWIKFYDTIICSTRFHKSVYEKEGAPREKLRVINNAVNTQKIDKLSTMKTRENIVKQFDIEPDSIIAGMFGRLGAGKDHETLVKAIPGVLSKAPGTTFLLVGSGPNEPDIRSLIESLNIGHAVRFTGFVKDDYYSIMAAVDIMVNISFFEGIPYVILDAMALRKPIVATNVGGVHEVITHDLNGFLLPSGSVEPVTEYLIRLINDKDLRNRFGEKSRKLIEKDYSIEKMNLAIEEVFLNTNP